MDDIANIYVNIPSLRNLSKDTYIADVYQGRTVPQLTDI
jgi:hypothetical protein